MVDVITSNEKDTSLLTCINHTGIFLMKVNLFLKPKFVNQ